MPRGFCLVCDKGSAVFLDLVVTRKTKGSRLWRIRVCQDCWRAFEALLDQAAVGVQPGLSEVPDAYRQWFL